MENISLPLGTNYISHWGTWEAVREILQNAMDQDDNWSMSVNHSIHDTGSICIESAGGVMEKSSLLLGNTAKTTDDAKRGKFGEGYKLALLVLARKGINVTIKNGSQRWIPSIQKHPQLGVDCLTIGIVEDVYDDELETVRFSIYGLTSEEITTIQNRVLIKEDCDIIADDGESYAFEDACGKPAVYVGGLFVCDLEPVDRKDYAFSYNFAPDVVELDRDRQTVSAFTIGYEATTLLNKAGEYDLLIDMASENRPDVNGYVTVGTQGFGGYTNTEIDKEITTGALKKFYAKYGDNAYPIDKDWSTSKIKIVSGRAIAAGLVPVTISKAFHKMFDQKALEELVSVELVPATQLIADFLTKNKKHMRSRAVKELKKMLEELETRSL